MLNRQTGKAAITDVVSNLCYLTCYTQMVAVGKGWLYGSSEWSLHPRGTLGYLSILGKGEVRKYPSARVPTHPLRDFGVAALGKTTGDELVCKYHGLTAI